MLRAYAGASRGLQVNSRLIRTTSQTYSTVPPPPPNEPTGKKSGAGSKLFLAILGTTAVATGTLVYAKKNQDFRDILKDYVPIAEDAISAIDSIDAMIFGEKEAPKPAPVTPSRSIAPPLSPINPPKKAVEPVEEKKPKIIDRAHVEDAFAIESAGEEAIKAYKRATETLNVYARKCDALLESTSDQLSQHIIDELKTSNIYNVQAEDDLHKACKKLDQVLGGGQGPVAERVRREVQKAKDNYDNANSAATVTKRYWDQVEQARRYFYEELQAMFPNADIGAQKLDLHGGNPDALLLLALRRVLLYQQILAKQEHFLSQRIEAALAGTDEDLINAKVEIALDRERQKLAIAQQKKELFNQAAAKKQLEAELTKQLDLHTSHLQESVKKHGAELIKKERQAADEQAEKQRVQHELQLATVLGRLQGVDDALKERSNTDKMARQSQKLWAACEALESALRHDSSTPTPLSPVLNAISTAAAESDELVAAVLNSVSHTIRERGVLSELALRERFRNVERACKRVALVPEEGGSLPVYFLSWLQSVFMINIFPISKEELEDQPMDFSKLDTYEILERARYWVDRYNWSQALGYINLLKGAPGTVSKDWANEVTLHLEARQAAKVLLAHASATGLLYL